jgi:hypothetical protein
MAETMNRPLVEALRDEEAEIRWRAADVLDAVVIESGLVAAGVLGQLI